MGTHAVRPVRERRRHRYSAEALEPRLLLASLLDLVGRTTPIVPAARGSGKAQQAQLAASDSQWDQLWLANHVSTATLTKLERADSALQSMYAQSLRDG